MTDYFTEECRIHCNFKKFDSPFEAWNKNKKELLEQTNDILELRDLMFSRFKMCNNFRITVALTILEIFSPKKWLDISAGWGDRLLAAIGYGVDRYFSADPNPCLTDKYKEIINEGV